MESPAFTTYSRARSRICFAAIKPYRASGKKKKRVGYTWITVELSVEKMLDIKKDDIGKKISIEEYNRICKKEVMKYKDVWKISRARWATG
jgi:hypothetical protein